MKTFQSLFPPLSPKTITLSAARRVVLISYNAEAGTIDWRHYIITVKPYGVSRRVRRVLEGAPSSKHAVLDLGNEKDVADFLLRQRGEDGGYESAPSSGAESEAGAEGDAVSLATDYVGRNNKKGSRRAIRLNEVGPRMELRLVKITEGVPGKEGAVIYHEFGKFFFLHVLSFLFGTDSTCSVTKSKKEINLQKAEHAAKAKLRKQRREEQEQNVARKKALAGEDQDDDDDDEAEAEAETGEEEQDHDPEMSDSENVEETGWDDEEEISEGEDSEASESSADEEEQQRPVKKVKIRSKKG